jgi:hypothetical protein
VAYLSQEQRQRLNALAARYASLDPNERFELVVLLGTRDDTIGTQFDKNKNQNRYTLRCPRPRNAKCCEGLIWAVNATIDHIDPDGGDRGDNFMAICGPCNSSKSDD